MKFPKAKYILCSLGILLFFYFSVTKCINTYRIEQQGGWWRNYIAECKDGYSGTYEDFILSLYWGDVLDGLIYTSACVIAFVIIHIALKLIIRAFRFHRRAFVNRA